jgi:hypothetical protein
MSSIMFNIMLQNVKKKSEEELCVFHDAQEEIYSIFHTLNSVEQFEFFFICIYYLS